MPNSFTDKAAAIAADLDTLQPDVVISVASMAVEVKLKIKAARARGCSFRQIATVFAEHGLAAEPDAIRIALGRGVVTKSARARKSTIRPVHDPTPAPSTNGIDQPPARAVPVASETKRGRANIAPRLK